MYDNELGQNLWTFMWTYKALEALEAPASTTEHTFDALWDLDFEEPLKAPQKSIQDTYGCTQSDMIELGVIHLYCTNKIAELIGEQ